MANRLERVIRSVLDLPAAEEPIDKGPFGDGQLQDAVNFLVEGPEL
jgi:hypothetical protein